MDGIYFFTGYNAGVIPAVSELPTAEAVGCMVGAGLVPENFKQDGSKCTN
jgi:hypothetical protein